MPTPPRTAAVKSLTMEALDDADAPVKIELCEGVELAVLPPRQWRLSALSALGEADWLKWAKGALASETDVDLFIETDPRVGEMETFMQRLGEVSAEGKSSRSLPSSTRSRRTPRK